MLIPWTSQRVLSDIELNKDADKTFAFNRHYSLFSQGTKSGTFEICEIFFLFFYHTLL